MRCIGNKEENILRERGS